MEQDEALELLGRVTTARLTGAAIRHLIDDDHHDELQTLGNKSHLWYVRVYLADGTHIDIVSA